MDTEVILSCHALTEHTTITCKKFWEMHNFRCFSLISELFYPLPHINVENYNLHVRKVYAVKIINIAIGGREENVKDEGRINFQNIFAHDCSYQSPTHIK